MNVDGIKSSIRLHNLKKYTTYFVWISATTSVGTGPTSSKHTFSTAEDGEYISSFHMCNFPCPPPRGGWGLLFAGKGMLVGNYYFIAQRGPIIGFVREMEAPGDGFLTGLLAAVQEIIKDPALLDRTRVTGGNRT